MSPDLGRRSATSSTSGTGLDGGPWHWSRSARLTERVAFLESFVEPAVEEWDG